MNPEIEVEIFRAGDYGWRGRYTETDVRNIAADYAPDTHEAPVTIDHRQDGPALGWVRSLRHAGGVLLARLGGLDAAFLEKLRAGAFKKRSIELCRRAEKSGRPYLRAVTFLGAASPVVKGMPDPVFAEENADSARPVCIDFDETPDEPAFAQPEPADRAFFADLERAGRMLPAWRERGIEQFIMALDDETPRSFAGPDAQALTARAWFRAFLAELAPLVPLGEAAPRAAATPFATLPGIPLADPRIDPASLALHQQTLAFRETNPGTPYADALRAVCAR